MTYHRDPRFQEFLRRLFLVPTLPPKEEYELFDEDIGPRDEKARDKLIEAYGRLSSVYAQKRSRAIGRRDLESDLTNEGIIGLIKAIDRFERNKGFKLATYAMFWIRAEIDEYLLRVGIIRVNETQWGKYCFSHLKRVMTSLDIHTLTTESIELVVAEFNRRGKPGVTKEIVLVTFAALTAPYSLDAEINEGNDDGGKSTFLDQLVDPRSNPEQVYARKQEKAGAKKAICGALETLDLRAQDVIRRRRLIGDGSHEACQTLKQVSARHGVSRERIRQIETAAMKKMKKHLHA